MIKQGLATLKDQECDIACLNVDLEKKLHSLYEKAGFKMMNRDISFENAKGEKDIGKFTYRSTKSFTTFTFKQLMGRSENAQG